MAIFTNTMYVTEDTDQYDIEPTFEGSAKILYEFSSDVYKLISGMYVADVMIESAVSEGATNADILVEETEESFKTKMVNTFKKLATKIKEWFRKIIEHLDYLAKGYKRFVTKNEKQINKNFDTMGGKITISTNDLNDPYPLQSVEIMKRTYNNYIRTIMEESYNSLDKHREELDKRFYRLLVVLTSNIDAKDISSIKQHIYRNDFHIISEPLNDVTSLSDYIDNLKSGDDVIKEFKDKEQTTLKLIDSVIKLINTEKYRYDIKTLSEINIYFSKCINLVQTLTAIFIEGVKSSMNQSYIILKKILTYKPAKESFNIFESALGVL